MGKGKRKSKNKDSKKTKIKRNEPKVICDNKSKGNPSNAKEEGLQKPHRTVKKIVYTLVTVVVTNELLNDLGQATIQLIGSVYIIESQNATLKLIPEDEIQHMKILAGVAYIECGNLMYNFGDVLPVILHDEEKRIVYIYSDVNLCTDLFSTLEGVAVDIKNYEDLVKVYKSAETYFYLNYVTTSSDDILVKYNEIIEKLLALDPSGDILSSRIIETGNSFVLDEYIANVEKKLSEIAFESNPFAFSLLKYDMDFV